MKQNEIIYFKFPWERIGITQYFSSKHQAIDNAGTVSGQINKYAYLPCEAKILKNTFYSDYGYSDIGYWVPQYAKQIPSGISV